MTTLAWWLVQHQPVFLKMGPKWPVSIVKWSIRMIWGIHEYPHDSVLLISKGLNFRTVLNNCDTLRLKLARVGIPGCAPGIRWLTLGEHVFFRDMRSRGWQHHERLLKSTYPGWWFGTWLDYDFPFSWECHHPKWRSHVDPMSIWWLEEIPASSLVGVDLWSASAENYRADKWAPVNGYTQFHQLSLEIVYGLCGYPIIPWTSGNFTFLSWAWPVYCAWLSLSTERFAAATRGECALKHGWIAVDATMVIDCTCMLSDMVMMWNGSNSSPRMGWGRIYSGPIADAEDGPMLSYTVYISHLFTWVKTYMKYYHTWRFINIRQHQPAILGTILVPGCWLRAI